MTIGFWERWCVPVICWLIILFVAGIIVLIVDEIRFEYLYPFMGIVLGICLCVPYIYDLWRKE